MNSTASNPGGALIELEAKAKINLSLRVLRKREDGFHEIETRMVPLEGVTDTVRVERVSGADGAVEVRCSEPGVPLDESNLVVIAVRALEKRLGRELPSLRISLEKQIPTGGGLGGGSSDAAAVLEAANQLFALKLQKEDLAAVAGEIGSDVPFFIYGVPCDCSGRGELVIPLGESDRPALPDTLLVKLPFGVETPSAYRRWMDSKNIPGVPYDSQETVAGSLVNDLERPVFEKFPVLAELKMWLLDQPEVSAALMSGSGATVFAFLDPNVGSGLESRICEHFGADVWLARSGPGTLENRS
jgi:4-diphosphocytidyl-2-C-methyl-D-erythritol kinase